MTLEMLLINCEVNLILAQSANCVILHPNITNQTPAFTRTETKLYIPALYLGFKTTIKWNKHKAKPELLGRNVT